MNTTKICLLSEKMEQYYETDIEPLFNGYVNEKHKTDCLKGMSVLYDTLKEEKITFKQWKKDEGDLGELFEKTHLSDGIPLYLEEVTGDHSGEICYGRQDDLVRFLISLVQS
tara:strand:+ start:1462 stop:1797 length:336 start_codon:yes stop_codon:yes gene_type:complete